MKNHEKKVKIRPVKLEKLKSLKAPTFLAIGLKLLSLNSVSATIPADAFSRFELKVYGMYATKDSTCGAGFRRVGAFHRDPVTINFADPNDAEAHNFVDTYSYAHCVLILAKNSYSFQVKSGDYSATTSHYLGHSISDSACNTGTPLFSPNFIYDDAISKTEPPGASEIPMIDITHEGLVSSLINNYRAGSILSDMIIPIYISTQSKNPDSENLDHTSIVSHSCSYERAYPNSTPKQDPDFCNGQFLDDSEVPDISKGIVVSSKLGIDLSGVVGGFKISNESNGCMMLNRQWSWRWQPVHNSK